MNAKCPVVCRHDDGNLNGINRIPVGFIEPINLSQEPSFPNPVPHLPPLAGLTVGDKGQGVQYILEDILAKVNNQHEKGEL